MKYNFDEIIDRRHTNSVKYDFPEKFGKPADAVPLWVADMDFKAPQEVIDSLGKVAEFGIYGYSDTDLSYGNTVKSWFNNRFGWETDPEWLVKTPGVIFAISAAVRAFTEPGEAVMIQQPVYHPFVSCVTEAGRKLVNNELINNNGRYEMNLADFEEQAVKERVKLFILCSPHNPVGRVWTAGELQAVGEICERNGILVVSDEIHCDFTYPGHPHTVYASLSDAFAEHSIICTAPSKTFNLAGLQTSNILIRNQGLRRKFQREIYLTGYDEINIFGLAACQAAYRYGETWLEELKAYLYENVSTVRQFLGEKLPQVRMTEPEGTYLLWVDFSGLGMPDDELVRFLEQEAKLWLNEGSIFGDKSGQYQRINIACPRKILYEALTRLEGAVHNRQL